MSTISITVGTPEAIALQDVIQKHLAECGYAEAEDSTMAEYITVMLANSKTAPQITEELTDLLGENYESSFTDWLFETALKPPAAAEPAAPAPPVAVAAPSGPAASPAIPTGPAATRNNKSLFGQALAPALAKTTPTQPSTFNSNKRSYDQSSTSSTNNSNPPPQSKRRLANQPLLAGGLADRLGPAPKNDDFQRKIDGFTRNGGANGRQNQNQLMQGMPAGMNPSMMGMMPDMMSQMNMGVMNGGMGNMQEMMMAQMAQMQWMQQQMAQQLAMQQQMAPQAGAVPQHNGTGGKARGGFGGGRGGRGGSHTTSSSRPLEPTPVASAPATNTPLPTKPTSTELCKFAIGCTNPRCIYSHPSPVATAESGMVLSTEACEDGLKCKDKDCIKGHASPAVLDPSGATQSKQPCKYQNCTNPACPYLHLDAAGNPIPAPALTNTLHNTNKTVDAASLAPVESTTGSALDAPLGASSAGKKACKWGVACTRADCSFSHPPGRVLTGGIHKSGFSPYSRPGSTNKSTTFNAAAPAFTPKSHISERAFTPKESGGEKIIPGAAAEKQKKAEVLKDTVDGEGTKSKVETTA